MTPERLVAAEAPQQNRQARTPLALIRDVTRHEKRLPGGYVSPDAAYFIQYWDDERPGSGEIVEFDTHNRAVGRYSWTEWPESEWKPDPVEGDIIGEVVWYDENDRETKRDALRADPPGLDDGPSE